MQRYYVVENGIIVNQQIYELEDVPTDDSYTYVLVQPDENGVYPVWEPGQAI